jgi:hypothetical protein
MEIDTCWQWRCLVRPAAMWGHPLVHTVLFSTSFHCTEFHARNEALNVSLTNKFKALNMSTVFILWDYKNCVYNESCLLGYTPVKFFDSQPCCWLSTSRPSWGSVSQAQNSTQQAARLCCWVILHSGAVLLPAWFTALQCEQMFLWIVAWPLTAYTAFCPWKQNSFVVFRSTSVV